MRKTALLAAPVALLAVACGDSDPAWQPVPPPLQVSDVITVGPITGFGSVSVNGIVFDTDSASVLIDGEPATAGDLSVGMIASILGRIDSQGVATASQIRFGVDAEGPISNLDEVNATFMILGKTIVIDEMTVIEGAELATLDLGNVVRVSGQVRSQDRIQATHIHRIANAYEAGMHMHVKGEIEDLDVANKRFRLGSQVCDYSGASLGLGGNNIANGIYVEVTSTTPAGDGDMILDRVQARDRDRDRDNLCRSGCDFELDGYVSSFTSVNEFEVDGQAVTTTPGTRYVKGEVGMLALDVRVAVDGTLDSEGVLVADRIVFHEPSLVQIEASVDAIDVDAGTVEMLGVSVATDEYTLFRDHSVAGVSTFGMDDVAVGDWLEIRAYIDSGVVIASRLERDDTGNSVTLKGPVEVLAPPSITVLDVVVTSHPDTVFQNAAFEVIDADTFFDLVSVGDIVKSEGTYDGAAVFAETMFLRDCQDRCL